MAPIMLFHLIVCALGFLYFTYQQFYLFRSKKESVSLYQKFCSVCDNRVLIEQVIADHLPKLVVKTLLGLIPFVYVLFAVARLLYMADLWTIEVIFFFVILSAIVLSRVALFHIAKNVVERYL
ncbi:TPA: hypothetical protein ACNICG_003457 [Acinetobacter baumannii]